jgi:hypothetical protein
MHQPADVGRKLLRLGAREEHAIVERVQESFFGNPGFLFHQDAMHHRDLAGRTAEAEQRHAQPDARRLLQRKFVLGNLGDAAESDRFGHSSSRG